MRILVFRLAFLLLFMTVFFTYPRVTEGIFISVMWLVLLFLMAGAGVYGYLKITKRSPESLGFTLTYDANVKSIWVGSKGYNVPLTITEEPQGLRVAWAKQNYLFLIVITALMAPGAMTLYVLQPQKFHFDMPFPMQVMAVLLWAVVWGVLIHTFYKCFFSRPSVLLSAESLRFFRGNLLKKRLWSRDVSRFSVEEVAMRSSDSPPVTNYVLVLHLQDGTRDGLCITDQKEQMNTIRQALRNRGYSLNGESC